MSKIVRADVREVKLTNEDPEWHSAISAASAYRGFVVRLESDEGTVGWGYGKEYYGRGVTDAYLRGAFEAGAARIVGEDCRAYGTVGDRLAKDHAIGHCQVPIQAIEGAILDITGQELGVPLSALLGGARTSAIPILRILSLKDSADVARSATELVAEGIRYLKIKLDNRPSSDDIRRVMAVREAVGPDVHLSVDANQTYDAKGAVKFWRHVEDAEVELFEQPVAADDAIALKAVKDGVGCLVEAHEAARSVPSLRALLEANAIDAVNIGIEAFGIRGVVEAAHLCDAFGIPYRFGVHLGPRVFVAVAAQVAAALPGLSFASELGEFARLVDDPSGDLEIVDGKLTVPTSGGIGVSFE